MVDIMIVGVIPKEYLERVERKTIPAVVIDSLHSREREEEGRLPDGHERDGRRDRSAEGVQDETLNWVVVQSTVGVRNVETVVPRMEVSVEELVDVKGAVPEVLPCVNA